MPTRKFDLNIERVLQNWTVAHAIREPMAEALDEAALTSTAYITSPTRALRAALNRESLERRPDGPHSADEVARPSRRSRCRAALGVEWVAEVERGRTRTFGVQPVEPIDGVDQRRSLVVANPPGHIGRPPSRVDPVVGFLERLQVRTGIRESEHGGRGSGEHRVQHGSFRLRIPDRFARLLRLEHGQPASPVRAPRRQAR